MTPTIMFNLVFTIKFLILYYYKSYLLAVPDAQAPFTDVPTPNATPNIYRKAFLLVPTCKSTISTCIIHDISKQNHITSFPLIMHYLLHG